MATHRHSRARLRPKSPTLPVVSGVAPRDANELSRRWVDLFSKSQLDEVRRWPGTAMHMRPAEPLVTFTAQIRPIMAARIEAIVLRTPLYAIDGPEGHIISRGVMVLEGETRMSAALDRIEATGAEIRNLEHWLAINDREKAEARAAKRKAGGLCPTCGAPPMKRGAR